MKVTDFFGEKIIYDNDGQMIFAVQKNGHNQIICDVRGWGAIQNLFRKNGKIDTEQAGKFQDEMGEWIAQAIREKMERDAK